jgi:hypothetical protein
MKKISLTRGQFALVDDDDYVYISKYKWTYSNQGYAYRQKMINGKYKLFLMHRVILENSGKNIDNLITDHKNCNKLDNRKNNLRACTKSQNGANRGKQKDNTSGYKGVWFCKTDKRKKRWVAEIRNNCIRKVIGYILTPKEAAEAYNNEAKKIQGAFAKLNMV